jgi:hypothetical protein
MVRFYTQLRSHLRLRSLPNPLVPQPYIVIIIIIIIRRRRRRRRRRIHT